MYMEELWEACPMKVTNNVNDIGKCSRDELYTLKQMIYRMRNLQ